MTALTCTSDRESHQLTVLAFMDERVRSGAATRVDTHISAVFLEPDRVLKIKRAIRLPFLDYSTLEKRKQACEAELAINRQYAPGLYRGVVPITQGAGGPEIGGTGTVLEWAVEMARFDESRTLDRLAAAGEIEPETGDALAEVVLKFHETARISDGATWLASVATIIDRNTEKFRGQPTLERSAVELLHKRSHEWLASCRPLLQRRASTGRVRRCHGDAHLGNIALIDQKPVLFDAIEFDPAMATTDVFYDLAFPLMDLVHFRSQRAANRLLNHYLEPTWGANGNALRLLSLYLSMRAAIRSLVILTKCEQSFDVAGLAEAKSYLELALRLITPARPLLVAIGGMSGTGKSVLARDAAGFLHPPPGAIILRSDLIRKELFEVDPHTTLPENAYSAQVSERVYEAMFERAAQITAQGFSAILDAAFLRASERSALEREACRMQADLRPIFLHANLSIRLHRVASREGDASDATREVAARQEQYSIGRLDWPLIDASGSPDETLRQSISVLLNARPLAPTR
jgi:uncharacterized protein